MRIRGESMRCVIVGNNYGVAVGIVAAEVAPVERAAAHANRERGRDDAAKETLRRVAPPHGFWQSSGQRRRLSNLTLGDWPTSG